MALSRGSLGAEIVRPVLFGRDEMRARLELLVSEAASGRGGLVWLTGEAGIGKTRLLAEVEALATARDMRVLHGAAWHDPGTPPFWLWAQVLREAAAGRTSEELSAAWGARSVASLALLPELGLPAGEAEGRFLLFDSVAAVVEAVASERPVAVVLDDLHWTDPGSLRLLLFLLQSLPRLPVLVTAAWRDHEVDEETDLAGLAAELALRGTHLAVAGLDADAVAALVAVSGGITIGAPAAARLRERTGGNPLFVGELARLAHERGMDMLLGSLPANSTAVIRRRLARVSQGCHDMLAVAAVAGTAATVGTVARLSGHEPAAVAAQLDDAFRAGLAGSTEGRIAIAHDLIREALIASLPGPRARELHLAVADLLEPTVSTDPSAAAEVAYHLGAALPLGDAGRALRMRILAGETAMAAQAYEEAAGHFGAAVALSEAGTRERFSALLSRGVAVLATSDLERARPDFLAAAELARTRGDTEGFAQAAIGFAAGLSGFEVRLWDQAQIDLLEEALELLPGRDSATRADVMARLSVAIAFAGDPDRRARLAADAVEMARRVGAARTLAHALAAHCDAIAGPGHSERREADAGEVVRLASEAGDRGLHLLGLRLRIIALLEQGQMVQARADMARFTAVAERLRQPLYTWYVPLWRGFIAHLEGDLAETVHAADEAERVGALVGSHNARVLAAVQRSAVAIEERRTDDILPEMGALVDVVPEMAPEGGSIVPMFPGQPAEVRRAFLPRLAATLARLPVDAEYLSNLCGAAMATYDAGGPPHAAQLLHDAMAPYGHRYFVDGIGAAAFGSVELFLGRLDIVAGHLDEAAIHLDRALDRNATVGATLALAHTHAAYADLLARQGSDGEEPDRREHLELALVAYRAMGLTARAAEVERLLGPAADVGEAVFRRSGDVWEVAYRGRPARVRHAKGMSDLAALLARPGQETHVLDLVGAAPGAHTGEVIDQTARDAYRRRLTELEDDLDRAAAEGNAEAATRAEREREFLVAELRAAYGLGGRARRTGDPTERARSAVTWRIREAIKRIAAVHPELGAHLRRAVRTGTYCSYDPDAEVHWMLR